MAIQAQIDEYETRLINQIKSSLRQNSPSSLDQNTQAAYSEITDLIQTITHMNKLRETTLERAQKSQKESQEKLIIAKNEFEKISTSLQSEQQIYQKQKKKIAKMKALLDQSQDQDQTQLQTKKAKEKALRYNEAGNDILTEMRGLRNQLHDLNEELKEKTQIHDSLMNERDLWAEEREEQDADQIPNYISRLQIKKQKLEQQLSDLNTKEVFPLREQLERVHRELSHISDVQQNRILAIQQLQGQI